MVPPGSLALLGLHSLQNQAQGCSPFSPRLLPGGLPASRLRSQSRRAHPAGSWITIHWGTNLSAQNHSEEFQAPCKLPFTPLFHGNREAPRPASALPLPGDGAVGGRGAAH